MRIKHLLAGTLAATLMFTSATAAAAVDAFLRIEGIKGESTDSGHRDELEIRSFSWGVSRPAAAGGAGKAASKAAGKAVMKASTFVHKVDAATPALFSACALGQHIKAVKLTLRKAGGGQQEFLRVTFSDVVVSSVTPSGKSSDDTPIEEVKLSYASIQIEYVPVGPSGKTGSPITTKSGIVVEMEDDGA